MANNRQFTQQLLKWYEENGRHGLPWKADFERTHDAYFIWLSEIMLQQTQVATVLEYYKKFTQLFPSVISLANADSERVMTCWSGLGYYARARNLHTSAKIVRDNYAGKFPTEFSLLIELPGIGRSTAAAISAFATGQAHAILDGNVKRVLARLYAIKEPTSEIKTVKKLWQIAEEHTPRKPQEVINYTQAIMDFGATLCARKPKCIDDSSHCFAAKYCLSFQQGIQKSIPVSKKGKPKPTKNIIMPIFILNGAVYLETRPSKGIWNNLWSLPEIVVPNVEDYKAYDSKVTQAIRMLAFMNMDKLYLTMTELFGIITSNDSLLNRLDNKVAESAFNYCINDDKNDNATLKMIKQWPLLKHSFSHYNLVILPLEIELMNVINPSQMDKIKDETTHQGHWLGLDVESIKNSPLPAPIEKILLGLCHKS